MQIPPECSFRTVRICSLNHHTPLVVEGKGEIFTGMEKPNFQQFQIPKPKKSDVLQIVDAFCKRKRMDQRIRYDKGLQRKYPFGRMLRNAKILLENCGGNMSDAMWTIERTNYWL